jgi:uncharacterized protein (DUF2236 family)
VQAYLASMLAGGQIAVGDTARRLAHDVLAPRLSWTIAPLRTLNRSVTVGLLPAAVRDQYGFSWTASEDARLQRTLRRLRALRAMTPDVIAHWPDARRQRR